MKLTKSHICHQENLCNFTIVICHLLEISRVMAADIVKINIFVLLTHKIPKMLLGTSNCTEFFVTI
jgi:hypothetical protein